MLNLYEYPSNINKKVLYSRGNTQTTEHPFNRLICQRSKEAFPGQLTLLLHCELNGDLLLNLLNALWDIFNYCTYITHQDQFRKTS